MQVKSDHLRSFAGEHLLYEVEQLYGLVQQLLQIRDHDEAHGGRDLEHLDMATRNAQVESFAIHARALLDFLYDHRLKPTDAVASDYIPNGWTPPKKKAPALDVVKPRVGKEIAHLSYKRIGLSDDKRQWPYYQVWLDLAQLLRTFARAASPERLPAKVAERILKLTEPPEVTDFLLLGRVAALSATNSVPPDVIVGPGTATHRAAPPESCD